jgi:hypothetical protein
MYLLSYRDKKNYLDSYSVRTKKFEHLAKSGRSRPIQIDPQRFPMITVRMPGFARLLHARVEASVEVVMVVLHARCDQASSHKRCFLLIRLIRRVASELRFH